MADEDLDEQETRPSLDVLQSMIDISADLLEGLRTQCATSAELTQQEIRTLEGKLIKLYAKQLVAKHKLCQESIPVELRHLPSLKQWLQVVGLGPDSIQRICATITSLEELQSKSGQELSGLLCESNCHDEELRRLARALNNLTRCIEAYMLDSNSTSEDTRELYWDSWDRHQTPSTPTSSSAMVVLLHTNASPRPPRSRHSRASVPSEEGLAQLNNNNNNNHCNNNTSTGNLTGAGSISTLNTASSTISINSLPPHISSSSCAPLSPPAFGYQQHPQYHQYQHHYSQYTPPSTPPFIKGKGGEAGIQSTSGMSSGDRVKFPTTPPPRKKHQTGLSNTATLPDAFPLTKSKSHESQLGNKIDSSEIFITSNDMALSGSTGRPRRGRLPTEPGPNSSSSEFGHSSPLISSPNKSPPYHVSNTIDSGEDLSKATLQVPKSPCTPTISRGMTHIIAHRFTKTFKMMTTCDFCEKQMFIGTGLRCKECKYKCHRDCAAKVPPSCALPSAYLDEFRRTLQNADTISNQSPNQSRNSPSHYTQSVHKNRRDHKKSYAPQPSINISPFPGPDSSSNTSSCNSSTPSSPALVLPNLTPHSIKQQFHFPDVSTHIPSSERTSGTSSSSSVTLEPHYHHSVSYPSTTTSTNITTTSISSQTLLSSSFTNNTIAATTPNYIDNLNHSSSAYSTTSSNTNTTTITITSTVSDLQPTTIPTSTASVTTQTKMHHHHHHHHLRHQQGVEDLIETHQSNDSDKTVSGSGSLSTDSERTPVRVDSQDSQVSDSEAVDRQWPRQNSLSMREWDIPFDELKIGEPIGTGRFGTVYRGNWHGDVAIKLLNMDYLDDEATLEAFKSEVTTFRKTRHENLVLFMGACMKLPRLAIVTSMCKGMTLYTHIHLRKDKFNMNKTTIVAQQISQGMGYLHARGIVHKDLKSKNIFLENGKVVITDFGLFSVTKLCYGNRQGNGLSIPPGWLCYLAPEVVRSLQVRQSPYEEAELPFSQASDVYAFGTVWYELLCGEWPFNSQPPEAIIWQVGKGMKQSLANLQASRDVKDILMLCWSFRPSDRPDFTRLLKTLERLPKKRLARSPSHPIHLSRSAESVF